MHKLKQIELACDFIKKQSEVKPEIGIILGSGLCDLFSDINNSCVIPYCTIPFFSSSKIDGHKNELITGCISNKNVVIMNGRCHYYEGFDLDQVTFGIRVMKALGVKTVIITTAAGAINQNYRPGDLMIVKDHINLTGLNPLIGPNDYRLGPRALELTNLYDKGLRSKFKSIAKRHNIPVHEGVYYHSTGPTFETPAEIKAFSLLGADAVGGSLVPEALIAAHSGLNVISISCLSNMAAGLTEQTISHEEVLKVARKSKKHLAFLLSNFIKKI